MDFVNRMRLIKYINSGTEKKKKKKITAHLFSDHFLLGSLST